MAECYECGALPHSLSKRSRCVHCEYKRSVFNEKENDALRERIAEECQANLALVRLLWQRDQQINALQSKIAALSKASTSELLAGLVEEANG